MGRVKKKKGKKEKRSTKLEALREEGLGADSQPRSRGWIPRYLVSPGEIPHCVGRRHNSSTSRTGLGRGQRTNTLVGAECVPLRQTDSGTIKRLLLSSVVLVRGCLVAWGATSRAARSRSRSPSIIYCPVIDTGWPTCARAAPVACWPRFSAHATGRSSP
ncbi:uncharacterized protein BP01DRAFT_211011 [Aspergillus saccharolyticus JOP 1030-1]|uniref:Uncharacterized protein n=1 Tax=Aspergillus saccharolyticus JOP 1030-1 TaxID=1450539 RepID=A0A318Z281_9EURO|nr:hypothetical protein BP01DRAFT_211011 [Aspergillus saccharolyticus JOP 1030-1]PYH40494.1 hypothetical protein BP01DRAFT_211011 [Aspergillus saccharolyticus JOP 1030-1]